MWRNGHIHTLLMEMWGGTATLKNHLAVSQNIKHGVTIDPSISLLGIYPREMKTYVHTKIWKWMSTNTLFITTKKLKQLKCPLINEQTKCGISISFIWQ